jgi:hypothetical protein
MMRQFKNEELAYFAGLFDGEGCVGFARVRSSYFVRVLVVNTNREVLEYLQECFGGDIKAHRRKSGWKQSWQWRLSWSAAINFLELIEPWLRIKENQAHLAFCWDYYRPGPGRGPIKERKRKEAAAANDYIKECFTFLNKRGIHNLEDPIQRELNAIGGEYA